MAANLSEKAISAILNSEKRHKCSRSSRNACVNIVAIADLPSRFGDFQVVAFANNVDNKEHAAFVRGDV